MPPASPALSVPTPAGEHVTEISPGDKLEIELESPPSDFSPPPAPRLSVRVDIRDAVSGRPVRGDVWLTTIAHDASEERLIREQTSLIEFELPGPNEADEVYLKVVAPGYFLWTIGLRHQVEYDRLLPLPVMLEPLLRDGGSG